MKFISRAREPARKRPRRARHDGVNRKVTRNDRGFGVPEGVFRGGSERVNWYLIEADDGPIVVDAGWPVHWQQLLDRLDTLGYTLADVDGCLLTHAHPDHLGFAQRLHDEADVPIRAEEAEADRARAGGDPPTAEILKRLWRPAVLRYFIEVVRSGGTSVPPVTALETFGAPTAPDLPGDPEVIAAPGHTGGSVAFYFPGRDLLFCGDALATVDFETWRPTPPRLLPPWLNVDHDRARGSLERFDSIGEVVLLPGHGEPWTGEIAAERSRA